jgi:dolichol-phosphate mannosyltransferase
MAEELSRSVELPHRTRLRHRVRRTHRRLLHGIRHPENWLQLLRFAMVGASGYVVNLVVFAICVHALSIDYRLASATAFVIAVLNNFWWNRHWTFDAREEHPFRQGIRFFTVSLAAFGFSLGVLVMLVDGLGLEKVVAQSIAVLCAMPLSFLGQKLWSFKA